MSHSGPPEPPDDDRRRRTALIGLVIAAALVLFGWWLARELTSASRLQDCVMSGRRNCAPIDTDPN
jgi:hypothetical protein